MRIFQGAMCVMAFSVGLRAATSHLDSTKARLACNSAVTCC